MSDDAHDDELGNLDDALFGDGDAKPAPPRDQAPKADIDWFAAIDETPAAGAAGAAAVAGAGAGADIFDAAPPIVSAPDPEDFPDLVGDPEGSPDAEWVFQEEPVASAVARSVESRCRRPHRRRGDLRDGGRSAAAAPAVDAS